MWVIISVWFLARLFCSTFLVGIVTLHPFGIVTSQFMHSSLTEIVYGKEPLLVNDRKKNVGDVAETRIRSWSSASVRICAFDLTAERNGTPASPLRTRSFLKFVETHMSNSGHLISLHHNSCQRRTCDILCYLRNIQTAQ